jgi:hypothetical protein
MASQKKQNYQAVLDAGLSLTEREVTEIVGVSGDSPERTINREFHDNDFSLAGR